MKRVLIAALMGLTFAGSAFAGPGFYLGIEGGIVFFEDTTDAIGDEYVSSYPGYGFDYASVEQDAGTLAIRPFVGWELTENLGLELGYMRFSQNTTITGTNANRPYKDKWDLSWNSFDFSVLLRPGTDSGLHGLFARVGVHRTTLTTDRRQTGDPFGGTDSSSKDETKSGALFGLGYDWLLGSSGHHAIRASFTHYANFVGLEDDTLNILRIGYRYAF